MASILGTPSTDSFGDKLQKGGGLLNKKSEAQLSCEAKGGRWTGTECILPETKKADPKLNKMLGEVLNKPSTPKGPTQVTDKGETLTRDQNGNIVGIVKDGETFFAPPNDEDFLDTIEKKAARDFRRKNVGGDLPIAGQAQQQANLEFQKQQIINEQTPARRELDPEIFEGEDIPVVGPLLTKVRKLLGLSPNSRSVLDLIKGVEKSGSFELQPEQLRTQALTEIERQEIERGLTANEEFGAFVEAIPLVGSLANRFAGGLIETPSENAREVKSNILKEKRRISNIETNVKMGYLPPSVADEQLTDIEHNVQRLESRMRLLISNSPELKFNSDYVNTVETEILSTREKALQAKLNILTGATQDPDELQILSQLQLGQDE